MHPPPIKATRCQGSRSGRFCGFTRRQRVKYTCASATPSRRQNTCSTDVVSASGCCAHLLFAPHSCQAIFQVEAQQPCILKANIQKHYLPLDRPGGKLRTRMRRAHLIKQPHKPSSCRHSQPTHATLKVRAYGTCEGGRGPTVQKLYSLFNLPYHTTPHRQPAHEYSGRRIELSRLHTMP